MPIGGSKCTPRCKRLSKHICAVLTTYLGRSKWNHPIQLYAMYIHFNSWMPNPHLALCLPLSSLTFTVKPFHYKDDILNDMVFTYHLLWHTLCTYRIVVHHLACWGYGNQYCKLQLCYVFVAPDLVICFLQIKMYNTIKTKLWFVRCDICI